MPRKLNYVFQLRHLGAVILLLAAVQFVGQPAVGHSQPPPNVVIIYTDDQGTIDANCCGATDLYTPHIDGLAANGIRFTQFYSAAPVCSPSRAALMTGCYPQRAGLAGNAASKPGGHGLPSEQITIAEILKKAGYVTGHVGKWHLGYTKEEMPRAQGFDFTFGHMGGCIDNYSHFFYWQGPNRHDLWRNGQEVWYSGEFFPELMVREASQFLEQNKTRPFFLYFPLNTPHYPLQGTEKWRRRYAHLAEPRRRYAEFVSTTDEIIGRLLAKLDDLKLSANTIVIFQSDHGHSTEVRTFGGGGSAGPYRGAKFSLFEGGIRVPAIIRWPGRIPAGETRGQMVTNVDWLPTICDLTGTPLPSHKIDGVSLSHVIRSHDAKSPHPVFHWQSGRGLGKRPQWAVRDGNWKLIGNPLDTSSKAPLTDKDHLFLIDLTADQAEMNNVADEHPELVARLKNLHDAWIKEVSSSDPL